MIVVTREEIERRWERTTHDKESDSVLRANIFYWPNLGFEESNLGRLAFMHLAKLQPGEKGYVSKHHHGNVQNPEECDPQVGMLEVYIHESGVAQMTVGDEELHLDQDTPVIVIQPGEVHSMQNLLDVEFRYWVYGFSTGGGTFSVE